MAGTLLKPCYMKNFKDFGIRLPNNIFTGDKVKINRILNKEIIIHDFKIEDSKFKPGTKCLYLQIEEDQVKKVLFTGSTVLMASIQQVPREEFPFKTTIIKERECFEFS